MSATRGPGHEWLLMRIHRSAVDAIEALLDAMAQHVAMATADAVTIRKLSADGRSLLPVAAHHTDPERSAAMAAVMHRTVEADSGLWQPVIAERRAVRWHRAPDEELPQASSEQAQFLRRFPIRAILAVPLVHDETVVGGLSIVRFSVDVPISDADEHLLIECAPRIAAALSFHTDVVGFVDSPN